MKSNLKKLARGNAGAKQSNEPAERRSHIVNTLVKKFLNEYLCLGFFRLSPCQDPAIKIYHWPRHFLP